MEDESGKLTQLLVETSDEEPADVAKKLMPFVYDELHDLAENYLRSERKGHTLQPTALVNEAFLRLVDQSRVDWKGRTHFFAVGAVAMRRILIDHARGKGRDKRGGQWNRVVLDDKEAPQHLRDIDVLSLHEALETLAAIDEQQSRIVELRFFAGLTVEEVAHVLGVSKRKVEGEWTHAKAWLSAALDPECKR